MRSKSSIVIRRGAVASLWLALAAGLAAGASANDQAWLDAGRSPDVRARLAVAAMTLDEKIGMLHGPMAFDYKGPDGTETPLPLEAIRDSAGFVPGVPRLGIPALYETDASLGVANPMLVRGGDVATALPSGLVLAGTFDPDLAYRAGALVGREARAKGFNVLLGGGMNLTRDPRNGRNFEYLGEDPWLAGVMAAEAVRGTQAEHVISTVKHFALNANETNRNTLDARADPASLRESDLLAFQIAIERGHPGSVMCAYNKVNGSYSCGNAWLLDEVLKRDWSFPGWVMSDWGAVHGAADGANGLDQESGEQLDAAVWFDAPLKQAVRDGRLSVARIDDMVERILRALFAVGVVEHPPRRGPIDYAAHRLVAGDVARQGIALLKNEGTLLPVSAPLKRIAVIGGHANVGVLSGGGSSQVNPAGAPALRIPIGGNGGMAAFRTELYDPSSPLAAIREATPTSEVLYDSGDFPADAAALAARSDLAIVFVTQHVVEGFDAPTMQLPHGQDALIAAVAAANAHTIVVLETGNPVTMPWLGQVPAVLAAWYPGEAGGEAIADILFGKINPSGRLAMSFPRAESDLVRPRLPNLGAETGADGSVDYTEGALVGYRWYAAKGTAPAFAVGHGLSYTRFEQSHLEVKGGKTLEVSFDVKNVGARFGADVAQVYLTAAADRAVLRLIGFERVTLEPGEMRHVTLRADPRLLASYDEPARQWRVPEGIYRVRLGESAADLGPGGEAKIVAQRFADRAVPFVARVGPTLEPPRP